MHQRINRTAWHYQAGFLSGTGPGGARAESALRAGAAPVGRRVLQDHPPAPAPAPAGSRGARGRKDGTHDSRRGGVDGGGRGEEQVAACRRGVRACVCSCIVCAGKLATCGDARAGQGRGGNVGGGDANAAGLGPAAAAVKPGVDPTDTQTRRVSSPHYTHRQRGQVPRGSCTRERGAQGGGQSLAAEGRAASQSF